jgi:SpoVK/Ycf46/Vps4 family AAA+-type ATPase
MLSRTFTDIPQIMQAVSRKIALDSSVDLEEYVDATQGFSGADLQAFIYNAQLEAVHDIVEEDRHDPSSRSNGEAEVFNGNFSQWKSGTLHESRTMAASERSVVSKQVSLGGSRDE